MGRSSKQSARRSSWRVKVVFPYWLGLALMILLGNLNWDMLSQGNSIGFLKTRKVPYRLNRHQPHRRVHHFSSTLLYWLSLTTLKRLTTLLFTLKKRFLFNIGHRMKISVYTRCNLCIVPLWIISLKSRLNGVHFHISCAMKLIKQAIVSTNIWV